MMQAQNIGSSEVAAAACALLVLMAPLAIAGLALGNAGLGRSRAAAHAMLSALCVTAVAALVFTLAGAAWQRFVWGIDDTHVGLAGLLQMFGASMAALIAAGAANERWRLGAMCASTALLAGVTFPLFEHWAWSGWLAQLGARVGWGYGFVDAGGAGTIQAMGGITALSIARILGPRHGKYSAEAVPAALPGHNVVLVLFSCLLNWLGWMGLNAAGALLFAAVPLGSIAAIAANTTLSAGAAALASAVLTRARFGRPDASLAANGWTAGLVASSAACPFLSPVAAIISAAIAGVLATLSVEWLDTRFGVDDPAGAISVHGVAGLWGLISVGLFASFPSGWALHGVIGRSGYQWLAQLAGAGVLVGFMLPCIFLVNWLLNRFYPQRISAVGEAHGPDLHELGAEAYPEFLTRKEHL